MRPVLSYKPFVLVAVVLITLMLLSFLPPLKLGDVAFRQVDLFQAIRSAETEATSDLHSESFDPSVGDQSPNDVASMGCIPGVTCIEDYSENENALKNFAKAIVALKQEKKKKPVRIAFYGDSFIEGDVFCGSVRDTLQTVFGGRGVGFVPITSNTVGFRNTIKQEFENWKTWSVVNKRDSASRIEMGPAGYCFKPEQDNWVQFRASKQRYLRDFHSLKLYYRNKGASTVTYTLNDSIERAATLKRTQRLREWKLDQINAKKVDLYFDEADSLELYGASFEGEPGIYVDNFSLRGNTGVSLDLIRPEMLKDFNEYRDYKLILLQYGLNIINADSARLAWYAQRMITVIGKMKEAFPKADIVLLSVSDRSQHENGKYKTLRSIPALRNTQRYIAKQAGIAFWDMYEAMGGENSMVRFVSASPALAARDYTHLTFTGGKKLADALVKSLLLEVQKFEQSNGTHP